MSTPFHPHDTCVWDDIPIGLGTSVVSFKPSWEACQTSGECINHHMHHTGITILTFWSLNSPIPFVISRSFWPLITCILQCPKLMTIWFGVSLLSTVMTEATLCDLWSDFPLTSVLTTNWLQGLFSTHWLATFFFFSSLTFSVVKAATTGSLAFTNFISLVTLADELLPPVYPNPDLSKKCFWD